MSPVRSSEIPVQVLRNVHRFIGSQRSDTTPISAASDSAVCGSLMLTNISRQQPPDPQRVEISPASLGCGIIWNAESGGTAPSSMALQTTDPIHATKTNPEREH